MHDEPKSESSFIEVHEGNPITYLGKYKHTNYHKVTLGGGTVRYVYIPDDNIYTCLADDLGDVFTYSKEITITSRVNLRSTPFTSSDNNIIVSMPKEASVTLLFVSDTGNWGYVQYEDYAGFVSMKYLE